jgi:hypothetical protein
LLRRGDTTAALTLYKEALVHFARAKLVVGGVTLPDDAGFSAAFDALGAVLDSEGRPIPSELERARRFVEETQAKGLDRLSAGELDSAGEDLDAAARVLRKLVVVRTPRELRMARALRVLLVVLLVVGLGWGLALLLIRPTNLALERPVSASQSAFGTSPSQAVNGARFGELGFHSELVDRPELTIDLGADYVLSTVKVYGRADCCFDQSIPLSLEVSRDGHSFRGVAKRAEPFSAYDPWVVSSLRATARYVRVKSQKQAYLVLAEVEVFGKPR